MLNVILFGPPGSGKGTQSEKVIKKYGLLHISTGDLLREEVAAETDLGLKAKAIMDKGELVSDKIVIGMIRKKLKEHRDGPGFIFDGFPRTVEKRPDAATITWRPSTTGSMYIIGRPFRSPIITTRCANMLLWMAWALWMRFLSVL